MPKCHTLLMQIMHTCQFQLNLLNNIIKYFKQAYIGIGVYSQNTILNQVRYY